MPGRIRYADLPAPVKQRLSPGPAVPTEGRQAVTGTASPNLGKGAGWRCHRCGQTFCWYAAAERHADQLRHRRIGLVL